MDQVSDFFADLWRQILSFLDALLAYLPNIFAALLLLLVSWLAAIALRFLSVRALRGLNSLLDRMFARGTLAHARLSETMIGFAGGVVFLVVLVFGLNIAARALKIEAATRTMDDIVAYLPTFIAGVVVVYLGLLAGRIIREVVNTALAPAGAAQAAYLGRFAQITVLVVAVVMGLDQIRIDVQLPISLIVVIAGTGLGGLSLAFGLGARAHTANLIASRQVAKQFQVGERIRVGDIQGVIVEIAPSNVVLDGAKGRIVVPASLFLDNVVSVVDKSGETKKSSE